MDGVILLSGPSVGIFGIMREQLPVPPGSPPEAYRAFDRVVAALREGDMAPELDASDPTLASLAYMAAYGEAGVRYMVEIDAVDPLETLMRVRQPVLIVQGGRDSSVPPHHAQALRATRDAAGLPTESSLFPDLTHFYKVGLDGMDPMEAFMLETESDPAVADEVAGWLTRVLR
jgi:pimeloyl-ACP methyl ester carboxylesterase